MKTANRIALKNQLESELYANKLCKISMGQTAPKRSKNLSILKIKNHLKIQFTQLYLSKHYRNRFLIFLGIFVFATFIILWDYNPVPIENLFLVIALGILPFLSYVILLCGKYFYYKKQIRDLSLDNVGHTIKFQKNFSHRKNSLKFTFDEIKLLTVEKPFIYPNDPIYKLSFVLKNNKRITIYTGKREICTRIGWNVARFSRKYCQYN